jgi:hypothetical protein
VVQAGRSRDGKEDGVKLTSYHGQLRPYEWLKLRIAEVLDLTGVYCWAYLVMWAYGIERFRDVRRRIGDPQECDYCGKCGVRRTA